ncbi:MAG: hypothetical protein J6I79_09615 [Paludibacteraceae bacterium]|nr:hypothetical protein [Paludibacteraceae bacterium]
MNSFEYNPISTDIKFKLKCECGEVFDTDFLSVPSPDFDAEGEHYSDSINTDVDCVECPKCGKLFEVELSTSFYGGEGYIDSDDVEILDVVENNPDFEEYISRSIFEVEHNKIDRIMQEIGAVSLSDDTVNYLYKLFYANLIAEMEVYLYATILKQVLSSDENKLKFLANYSPFRERKFNISEVVGMFKNLSGYIKETLNKLVYHNMSSVSKMYKDVLNIELGDVSFLKDAISKRHDIVHRNGKTLDGKEVVVTKDDVIYLSKQILDFMYSIELKIKND